MFQIHLSCREKLQQFIFQFLSDAKDIFQQKVIKKFFFFLFFQFFDIGTVSLITQTTIKRVNIKDMFYKSIWVSVLNSYPSLSYITNFLCVFFVFKKVPKYIFTIQKFWYFSMMHKCVQIHNWIRFPRDIYLYYFLDLIPKCTQS